MFSRVHKGETEDSTPKPTEKQVRLKTPRQTSHQPDNTLFRPGTIIDSYSSARQKGSQGRMAVGNYPFFDTKLDSHPSDYFVFVPQRRFAWHHPKYAKCVVPAIMSLL